MTRTLTIADTTCGVCSTWYETVEEAIECERLDIAEDNAVESDNDDHFVYAALG